MTKTAIIHTKCGGLVVDRKCRKCGKVWNPISYLFARDVVQKRVKFSEKGYKKRIRRLDDLPK